LAEPVFLVDEKRRILLANLAAEKLFGAGLAARDFVHAIRHPDALSCVDEALAGRDAREAIMTLPGPVRSTFRISAVRLRQSNEIGAAAVISLTDISHVLEAEQMRSDFVANVSHELRSPLTALMGGIETLKGAARDDPAARERFLDTMEREAARMDRLVGDLLSLSRVEVNEHVRPSGRVNLATIIEKAIDAMATQSRAENRPITCAIADGDWEITGDADELTQVFHNLIDNALKYGRENSEIRISAERRDRVPGLQGPALAVRVQDEGEGIDSEHLLRITERFYRVDDSRSRQKGGTGLGLAIVKHILNRHRGRLLIESEKGVGSTFTVCLPLELDVQKRELS
ncbi:MAG: hypothetical protein D6773_18150, partial [Alphaproteobacteria bacterium]